MTKVKKKKKKDSETLSESREEYRDKLDLSVIKLEHMPNNAHQEISSE